MRTIQRSNTQASGNPWVLSLIQHTALRLDGQTLTLRITSDPLHDVYLKLLKVLYAPEIQRMEPAKMSNVTVKLVDDLQAPDDFILTVDWSNYSGPGGGIGGFLGLLGLTRSSPNLGDFTFHDWRSTKLELAWVQDALEARLYFQNKPGPQLTYQVCGTGIQMSDLVLTVRLIPYVYWSAEVEPRLGHQGLVTGGYWLSGRNLYKHRCALSLDMSYSNISPANAAAGAMTALGALQESIAESLPQDKLFRYVEALFIKDNDLTGLVGGETTSRLRGVDLSPGLARFLYFDEEDDASVFIGHGRIVAVRKDRIKASLLPPSGSGPASGTVHDYQPDNIIEVEVQKDDGARLRISTLNLVRSMLEGKAKIDGVHVVLRDRVWGEVCSKLNQTQGAWQGLQLYYSGYLRSNPDAGAGNNLDHLPKYDYNWADPLYRNLYDGTFYFFRADLLPSGLQRYLYHRAWHLPFETDSSYAGRLTETQLLNGYMVFDRPQIPRPYKVVLTN